MPGSWELPRQGALTSTPSLATDISVCTAARTVTSDQEMAAEVEAIFAI